MGSTSYEVMLYMEVRREGCMHGIATISLISLLMVKSEITVLGAKLLRS